MIPNIFSLLGESIVGKHIAKGIIFSNSPKKFHPNGSRIQVYHICKNNSMSVLVCDMVVLYVSFPENQSLLANGKKIEKF